MVSAAVNVFEAVEAQARRTRDRNQVINGAALKRAAAKRAGEIQEFRALRDHIRQTAFLRQDINGAILTLDMHPLEVEACKQLCPLLNTADWKAKKEAWLWVLKQPWGKEFRAPGFEQKRWTMRAS